MLKEPPTSCHCLSTAMGLVVAILRQERHKDKLTLRMSSQAKPEGNIAFKLPTLSISQGPIGKCKGYNSLFGNCWHSTFGCGWKLPQELYNRSNLLPRRLLRSHFGSGRLARSERFCLLLCVCIACE